MMTMSFDSIIVVDTFAWVEYFAGTEKGKTVAGFLENKRIQFFTPEVCVAELKCWAANSGLDFKPLFNDLLSLCAIVSTDLEGWLSAAATKCEKRKTISNIGLLDCIVIHHANQLNARILTGDQHFAKEKNAILV
jgi:predicted nucleic acid-binding protein